MPATTTEFLPLVRSRPQAAVVAGYPKERAMTADPFRPATLETETRCLRAAAARLVAQAQACAALARFGAEHDHLTMFAAQVEDAVAENLGETVE